MYQKGVKMSSFAEAFAMQTFFGEKLSFAAKASRYLDQPKIDYLTCTLLGSPLLGRDILLQTCHDSHYQPAGLGFD